MTRTREEEVRWWILMIEETEESKLAYMIVNAITAARREGMDSELRFLLALQPSFCNGLCSVHPDGSDKPWPKCTTCKITERIGSLRSLLLPGQPAENETKGETE